MNKKDKHNNYGKLVAAAENGEKEREKGRGRGRSRGARSRSK